MASAAERRSHRHRWLFIIGGIAAIMLGVGIVVFAAWQAQSMLPHGDDPGCLIVGECTTEQLDKAQKMWLYVSYGGMGLGIIGVFLHLWGLPVRVAETVNRHRFISSRLLTGTLTAVVFSVVAYTAITRATSLSDIFTRVAIMASGVALAWLLIQTAGYRTARPRATMLVAYIGGLGSVLASSWLLFNTVLLPFVAQFGGEMNVTVYMAVFAGMTLFLLLPVMLTMALLSRPWRIESDPTETITLPPHLLEELAAEEAAEDKAREDAQADVERPRTAASRWAPSSRPSEDHEPERTAVQPAAESASARRSASEVPAYQPAPRRGSATEPETTRLGGWAPRDVERTTPFAGRDDYFAQETDQASSRSSGRDQQGWRRQPADDAPAWNGGQSQSQSQGWRGDDVERSSSAGGSRSDWRQRDVDNAPTRSRGVSSQWPDVEETPTRSRGMDPRWRDEPEQVPTRSRGARPGWAPEEADDVAPRDGADNRSWREPEHQPSPPAPRRGRRSMPPRD